MTSRTTSESVPSVDPDAPDHRPKPYVIASVAILVAAVAAESLRFAWPWPNVPAFHSYTVSSAVIAVLALAIPALVMRRQSGRLAVAAWTFSFAAPVALFLHAMMTRIVANSYLGFGYLAVAAALAFTLKRVWDGSELARARRLAGGERRASHDTERSGAPVSSPAL